MHFAFAPCALRARVCCAALALSLLPSFGAASSDEVFVSPLLCGKIESRAVFPMQNISVEPEVAHHFCQRVQRRLVDKGYAVLDGDWGDKALYRLGLNHAGQLSLVLLPKLAETIEADAFVFGLVEEAATRHALAYDGYACQSSLKLQQPDGEGAVAGPKRRCPNAASPSTSSTPSWTWRKAAHALADRLLASLPDGPFRVVVGDDLLGQAVTLEATLPEEASP